MRTNWREEVGKFRAWAATLSGHFGEWECDYDGWEAIYKGVGEFLSHSVPKNWDSAEVEDLLYIVARDNEGEVIANMLREINPEITFRLALQSLMSSDPDGRWQIADVLDQWPRDERTEPLLLRFMEDEAEYVRRRALQSLARIGSAQTESLALREWNREDENQQWSRMNALRCWHHIKSSRLETHLREAEASPYSHLPEFARKLRNGELHPWQQPF